MATLMTKIVLLALLLSGCAAQHHGVRTDGPVSGAQASGATTSFAESRDASSAESARAGSGYYPNASEHLAGAPGQESSASPETKAVPLGTKVVIVRVVLGIAIMYAVACGILAC